MSKIKMKIIEPKLTETGKAVMSKRYLQIDMKGEVVETPGEMLWRVARHMAKAEIYWGENGVIQETAEKFYERMVNWKFVCAGKAMFEAGNPGGNGQLSSCFVLPITDSIDAIFKTLGEAAVVHKNNGGTGFNFSAIRPHGDKVKNVPKAASGPVDFLRAYSAALSQILQGSKRQGANIAILNADHPDIEEFITLKTEDGTIKNFNVSVGVSNAFMEAVQRDEMWELKSPRNGEVWKKVKARKLFGMIAEYAWATGDPGLAFLDRLEEDNPTPSLGKLEATNPCIVGSAMVATENGLITLEEIVNRKMEVLVLTHKNRFRRVVGHYDRGVKRIFELVTDKSTILATGDHRFYTGKKFVELQKLNSGDVVWFWNESSEIFIEAEVKSVSGKGEERVYDLSVEEDRSFVANGLAVHNCGEIPLLPYESCNLTSICLQNHLKENKKGEWEVDWDDLEKSVRLGIRFLDNMIEVNTYALEEIRQMVKEGNRRIGLGVMGFAHMLYKMRISYNSKEAVRLSERLAKFMRKKAEETSLELGRERGTFGNWDISIYAGSAEEYRNCAVLMIAPTGTTSLIADTSSGIEPVFSLVTVRRSFNEDNRKNAPTKEFTMVDPEFEKTLQSFFKGSVGSSQQSGKNTKTQNISLTCVETGEELKTKKAVLGCVVEHGLRGVKGLPKWMYKTYVTTHEIEPEWHVRIQAAWQKWIDNSVSKTINFPNEANVEDVKKAYMLGWQLGLKGITIYRDGSKMDQVLNIKGKESKTSADVHDSHVSLKPGSGQAEMCPECGAATTFADGCVSCAQCGWSKCSL